MGDETPPPPPSNGGGTARLFGNMLNEKIKGPKKKHGDAFSPWTKMTPTKKETI